MNRAAEILASLGASPMLAEKAGLIVASPIDGAKLAEAALDTPASIARKIERAALAQQARTAHKRELRVLLLEALSATLKANREKLAELITLEAGKTGKEALAEVDGAADILLKTIKDAALPEFSGMERCKERPPVGVVGLITSFNFPLVVAHWTIAPALLAGNAVIWKPSEKTPLVALGLKALFDKLTQAHDDLLQLAIGGHDIGAALFAHEQVDMISATGSVGMGKAIKAALAKKKNHAIKPILELGGNNGVIISEKMSDSHRAWSVKSLLNSYLGTAGQRCTNTRRLIVHRSFYEQTLAMLERHVADFITSGAIALPLSPSHPSPASGGGLGWGEYGYGPLIDRDAFERFEHAKKRAAEEGGRVLFGKRLLAQEYPDAYYVEPAIAALPAQGALMHEETFAPLLFVVPYDGDIGQAIQLLNAPANAGLAGGIYTQSRKEAEFFAQECQAGHVLINSPKGTGTPAFGMGFGGNKDSGEGEILNAADPLRPFTRDTHYRRIAMNKEIALDQD